MRIGVSLTSAQAGTESREGARLMIERAAAARKAGLDSLFVGDHHNVGSPYYQNVPMTARLLAEWGDATAGCLFLLPLWNPVLIAEQVGTLASIAEGPFVVQCALGDGRAQFGAMGVNIKLRPSLFEESLDIVKRLLGGETVSGTRRFPSIDRARVSPLPPEHVDFWVGGSAEASVDRAARVGEGFLGGPELTPERAGHWATFYRDQCKSHGRLPGRLALRRDVYVGASAADAEAVAGPILDRGYRGIAPDSLVFGDPERVAEQFRAYSKMGYTDIIIRHLTNDRVAVLGSYGRLAEVRRAVAND
jgi:alkanesulfonate monooxygenase SsuD/methylene tetrahydromethanopterin reductase-like flavin-dependent oxidoreductase (luciferase family)